jgi:hypothetical protein
MLAAKGLCQGYASGLQEKSPPNENRLLFHSGEKWVMKLVQQTTRFDQILQPCLALSNKVNTPFQRKKSPISRRVR